MSETGASSGATPSALCGARSGSLRRNLTTAIEEGGRALAAYLSARDKGQAAEDMAGTATDVLKHAHQGRRILDGRPARLVEAQTRLFANYFSVWQTSMAQAAGKGLAAAVAPKAGDKRFKDPDWTDNPVFSALKQLYLATTRWAEELVEKAEGLDEPTRLKARFYIQQINNALSPTNFLITNPEVLKETAASNAENLARGMKMLAEDIEAGHGTLRLRQTDFSSFKLGENIATTPGKVVFQNELCQVIQYQQTVVGRS